MRNFLIGAAGSALVLFLDLTVTQFGKDNIPLRMGMTALAFALFSFCSWILSAGSSKVEEDSKEKPILSDIESVRDTSIDVEQVDSVSATKIVSGIKSGKNTDIKMHKIKS